MLMMKFCNPVVCLILPIVKSIISCCLFNKVLNKHLAELKIVVLNRKTFGLQFHQQISGASTSKYDNKQHCNI